MSYHNHDRTNKIKNILDGNELKSLIDLECNDTEAFINTKNDNDIRDVLDKKILDFGEVISKIVGKLVNVKSGKTGHTFSGFTSQVALLVRWL